MIATVLARRALVVILAFAASPALAKEIHLDCAREGRRAMIDVDTDRAFLQMTWGDGVAEEFKDGDFYISGPDSDGAKEKIVYSMSFDKDMLYFGTDRTCVDAGAKGKCGGERLRHTIDLAQGVLKYEDVGAPIVMKCATAARHGF
jgi:hypothetical protein